MEDNLTTNYTYEDLLNLLSFLKTNGLSKFKKKGCIIKASEILVSLVLKKDKNLTENKIDSIFRNLRAEAAKIGSIKAVEEIDKRRSIKYRINNQNYSTKGFKHVVNNNFNPPCNNKPVIRVVTSSHLLETKNEKIKRLEKVREAKIKKNIKSLSKDIKKLNIENRRLNRDLEKLGTKMASSYREKIKKQNIILKKGEEFGLYQRSLIH